MYLSRIFKAYLGFSESVVHLTDHLVSSIRKNLQLRYAF